MNTELLLETILVSLIFFTFLGVGRIVVRNASNSTFYHQSMVKITQNIGKNNIREGFMVSEMHAMYQKEGIRHSSRIEENGHRVTLELHE